MIFENYGKYVEDMEKEGALILDYFGRSFIDRNFKKNFYSFLESESFSESQGACLVSG